MNGSWFGSFAEPATPDAPATPELGGGLCLETALLLDRPAVAVPLVATAAGVRAPVRVTGAAAELGEDNALPFPACTASDVPDAALPPPT